MLKKILVLKSSIMGAASQTNALMDLFLAEHKAKNKYDEVKIYDLSALNLPVLDSELFNALRGDNNPSERARNAVALSDQLIADLNASDVLLIGAPMYNLNVPTQLKNWFDLVARAGVTFRYTESYPLGLVTGVNAVVFSSRGGLHLGLESDAVTPYLRSVLGLIGIEDVQFVYAEGMDIRPQGKCQGLEDARTQITNILAAC